MKQLRGKIDENLSNRFLFNLISKEKYYCFFISQRSKRQTTSVVARNNLFVEYLAVIDSGVYDFFVSLYGSNMPTDYINDYINIYFTQLINGVIQL
jgi:hypothetical protein